jgi:deoxyribonuclease V
MILAVDVCYHETSATIAGVIFTDFLSDTPENIIISEIETVEEYISGEFYKRELPCIVQLLEEHNVKPNCIIVDGFVYLDGKTKPGLGKKLFDYLNGEVNIIGVAKNPYDTILKECEVYRGKSQKPLYVTSVGIDITQAKKLVKSMHGEFRVPTLLKRVDKICRRN